MNRIVREHYPASKLPEELRTGIDPERSVTVTIVEEDASTPRLPTLEQIFSERRPPFKSAAEIDAEVRRLRDEWGER